MTANAHKDTATRAAMLMLDSQHAGPDPVKNAVARACLPEQN
jgi:hypothetical protein